MIIFTWVVNHPSNHDHLLTSAILYFLLTVLSLSSLCFWLLSDSPMAHIFLFSQISANLAKLSSSLITSFLRRAGSTWWEKIVYPFLGALEVSTLCLLNLSTLSSISITSCCSERSVRSFGSLILSRVFWFLSDLTALIMLPMDASWLSLWTDSIFSFIIILLGDWEI